jgi:hypothetical protein
MCSGPSDRTLRLPDNPVQHGSAAQPRMTSNPFAVALVRWPGQGRMVRLPGAR